LCAQHKHHSRRWESSRKQAIASEAKRNCGRVTDGSAERSCGLTHRNRMRGAAERGEQAKNCEATMAKAKRRRSGGRAAKGGVCYLGRPRLTLERATPRNRRSEESAEAIVAALAAKGRT